LQPINQLAQELASMRDKMAGAIDNLTEYRDELPEELQEAVDVLESVRDGQLLGQIFDTVEMTESDHLALNGILIAKNYELEATQRQTDDSTPDGTNYDDLIDDLMNGYDFDELTQ